MVAADGSIDRKVLGPRVFADPHEMKRLNDMVWPEIKRKVEEELSTYGPDDVVVMEAAVLIDAGWSDDASLVDEVWVTFIDTKEAVKRVVQRNHVTEEEAEKRVSSQLSNEVRLSRADVLLTTLFEKDVTVAMCQQAWEALQQRVKERKRSLSGMGVRERWEWVVKRLYGRKEAKAKGSRKSPINLSEEAGEEKDGDEEEEEETEWTPVKPKGPKRRGVKKEESADAEDGVVVKKEKAEPGTGVKVEGGGDDEVMEVSAVRVMSTESLIVKWWSVLPHSEAIDAVRAALFRLFDQQRPNMKYPEEVTQHPHKASPEQTHRCPLTDGLNVVC